MLQVLKSTLVQISCNSNCVSLLNPQTGSVITLGFPLKCYGMKPLV